MNWQALGAIGELVGALAVFVTLLYLAIQLRLNTKALRSSTFQDISVSTAMNMQLIATTPGMSELILKAQAGLDALNEEERIRFGAMIMSSFRRVEAVYIHQTLGAIEPKYAEGFKRSSLSALAHRGVSEWWDTAQDAFTEDFVLWVNSHVAAGKIKGLHMGIGR
jgi:hypothetical protein